MIKDKIKTNPIKIFYFSATGNSYTVAKTLVDKLKAQLISIPKAMKEEKIEIPDGSIIGIVFLSYMAPVSGIPQIIERFIKRITNIKSLHIIAVCTCGGYECVNALPSLHKLRKVIRLNGGRLAEEYSVRLPMNNLEYDHIPIPIVRDTGIIIDRSRRKIDCIIDRIVKKKDTRQKIVKDLFYFLMLPLFKMLKKPVMKSLYDKAQVPAEDKYGVYDLMPLTDRSIIVDDKCRGCGTCVKVCPVNSIILVDKKPVFQHHCEMCFACDEWCPSNAIHHWSRKAGVKYHHPEVHLSDFI